MFSLFYGLWKYVFSKTEFHVLILGIDKAGKTTLLEKLKSLYSNVEGLPPDRIVPTVGLNIGRVEASNTKLVFWDLGGQSGLRPIWEKYFEEAHAVIYVIDAASPSRFEDSKSALEKLLRHEDLQGAPLLIVANKQDLAGAVSVDELSRYLDLKELDERQHMFEAVCAHDGTGVKEGIDWLVEVMQRSKRTERLRLRADQDRNSSSYMSAMATQICNQISSVFSPSSTSATSNNRPSALSVAVEEIKAAVVDRNGRVFVHGVGREGLMLKALCMRLSHLGISAHCVGDMTTPPISSSDLLIASAGPGGFSTVDAICGVAKSNGARVLLFTAQPDSGSATQYATAIGFIPAQTMANDDVANNGYKEDELSQGAVSSTRRDLLPMGSVYEGAMFVLFEMVVYELGSVLGQTPDAIRSRHTNLE
ncbi:hypothetical protein MKW92_016197 [Papaver armeniacum]|nr:hypothetical protein MKW92_016197 [Papaver armeniacum]